MNLSITRFILIGIGILMSTSTILQGQNIFWSEDFSNGIPSDWSNLEVNNSVAEWEWEDDPTTLIFIPQPPFAAATANNGFVYFDSDDYNLPHDARLISSVIDCSNQSTVIVHFENQYDFFTNISQPILEVSKDSLTWVPNNLFTDHPKNHQRDHVQVVELDISSVAANEPNVYLRFRWIGVDEYIWRIDDIRLQDSFSPPTANDLIVRDVTLAPNFRTPLAHVKDMVLGGDIFNNGSQTAHNVRLTTSIIDTVSNVLVYLDSASISSILPGNLATLQMPTNFLPTTTGKYKIHFNVTSDSLDQANWDNQKVIPFEVINNNIFQKNFEFSYLDANAGNGDEYEIGNLYDIENSGHYAYKIYFTAANSLAAGPLLGRSVDVKLYEVPASLDQFLSDLDTYRPTLLAFGSYTFTAADQYKADLVGVEILDINNNRVLLKPNTRYLAMVSFSNSGNSNNVRIGLDDSWRYEFKISSVAFSPSEDKWYERGFGSNLTPIVLLETSLSNKTKETDISSNLTTQVKLYPNPVTEDNLAIQFDFEKGIDELNISIDDITGKHFFNSTYYNISKGEIRLNTKNYPKGVYFLTITTGIGEQFTKRFVVE